LAFSRIPEQFNKTDSGRNTWLLIGHVAVTVKRKARTFGTAAEPSAKRTKVTTADANGDTQDADGKCSQASFQNAMSLAFKILSRNPTEEKIPPSDDVEKAAVETEEKLPPKKETAKAVAKEKVGTECISASVADETASSSNNSGSPMQFPILSKDDGYPDEFDDYNGLKEANSYDYVPTPT